MEITTNRGRARPRRSDEGVIPKARAFTSGPRDLARIPMRWQPRIRKLRLRRPLSDEADDARADLDDDAVGDTAVAQRARHRRGRTAIERAHR